jgi:DNA-binding GntR family transcriptional regulator
LVERGERGWIVRHTSPEEIFDIYEAGIVLEAADARAASERRTAHDLAAMRRLAERMSAIEPNDPNERAQMNSRFHAAVWKASHNQSMIDLLERLGMHLGRYPSTTLSYPGRWKSANDEHDRLVAAIDKRDADEAARIATDHFTASRDIRLEVLDLED